MRECRRAIALNLGAVGHHVARGDRRELHLERTHRGQLARNMVENAKAGADGAARQAGARGVKWSSQVDAGAAEAVERERRL